MIKYSNFVDFIIILPIRSFNITNIFFLIELFFKKKTEKYHYLFQKRFKRKLRNKESH